MFQISPEEIFKGELALLDVNFFNPNEYDDITTETGDTLEQTSSALILQPTISKWYYSLRSLAIVALLSILVYIGIRIVISSSAEDKAKYKQRLMDWLVAMCILFFMHYIMAFAVTITEEITKAISSMNSDYFVAFGNGGDGDERKLEEYKFDNGEEVFGSGELNDYLRDKEIITTMPVDNAGNTQNVIQWHTNLMGKARIDLQLEPPNITEDQILMRKFGYTVIYLALVIYTMLFLFRYLKRLLMLAFLTIIAPLMAMTYPLDKIKDGSAQGFNMWIKEYIFNLLIQPVDLILYTVLIGSAIDLVVNNLIYGLVALGFILQGEKVLRKFFGLDKASTVDGGSALGGALAMQGINQLGRLIGRGKGKDKEKVGGGNQGNKPLPQANRKPDDGNTTNSLMDDVFGNNPDSGRELNSGNNAPSLEGPEELTPQQRMLDAYDENWGTDEYDPAEREAMAREVYNQPEGMNYTADEYADILRDSGYGEDEINSMVQEQYGSTGVGEEQMPTLEPLNLESRSERAEMPTSEQPSIESKRERAQMPKRKISNRLGQVGREVAYIAPRAGKAIGKRLAKTAIKGTLMGAGAVTGIAAGLVSDNYANVVKWGAAGAGAGALAGSGITGIPGRVNGVGDRMTEAAQREFEATHTEDEIRERRNKQADKAFLQDKAKIRQYANELNVSEKQAKEIMKKDAMQYRQYGVTDDDIIIKAMKADKDKFGSERASQEKILLAKMASEVGGSKKELEHVEKGLSKRGVSKEDITKYSNAIRDINKWT